MPHAKIVAVSLEVNRMKTLAAVLSLCTALAACSSQNSTTPDRAKVAALSLRQPTVAELSRFLPGGVPAHGIPLQAPLPCGGVAKSVRRATTAIRVPHSLLALSVSEYEFASRSAVNAYVNAIQTLPKPSSAGHNCDLAVANSGDFYPVTGTYLTDDGYYLFSAATHYGRGIYSGSDSYTSIAYVVHGDVVFVTRVDRQGGNPSGTPYNITFERQLPDPTPSGLLIPGTAAGTSATIRWGTTVRLMVDTFSRTETEPYFPCRNGTTTDENYVDILWMKPAK